jgi:CBS domain-containing protein
MIQNKVRHLLVVENDDTNRPLGIITATDFVAYLKENLNIDDVKNPTICHNPVVQGFRGTT